MRRVFVAAVLAGLSAPALAEPSPAAPADMTVVSPSHPSAIKPVKLAAQDDESVYARPTPPTEAEMYNQGGVHLDFKVSYMTDYVYRGIDHSETGGHEDAPNLQFDGIVKIDLPERWPDPFIGVFVNVYDSDPISRFQEIRPYFGLELTLRPFIIAGGHTTYIFPNREKLDTNEIWGKVTLMDDFFLRRGEPLLSPYIYGAYDYDLYNGWYLEAGVSRTFTFSDLGLPRFPVTFTVNGLVSYVWGMEQFALIPGGRDSGFQRYEIAMVAKYSLNQLLNIPRRYGQWSFNGYINYTDNLKSDLHADRQIWGGGGIEFYY